ncbi:snf7 family protein [Grosmannia clavigera kw1407]|uniref:Snf7 family protein n=1 Tax=Grosmannia clavigera (strain kw1407 / UAMH 11150) TaxID=655863 RepID=F0XES3_GROCL|nr:snf7 family protein [Grosmannia clavigera kw1407]EFX04420.1 snf7 family protein [Grosmannia clavigera kw1407]
MISNAQRIQFLVSHEEGFSRSRLPALYSDFRGLLNHNPEGYAANVSAWRRGLTSLVRQGMLPPASSKPTSSADAKHAPTGASRNRLILSAGPQLLDALQSDRYGAPDALDAVLREAVQDRDLVPLTAFLSAKESIYGRGGSWASWAAAVPWNVLSWGLHQLGGLSGLSGLGSGSGGGKIPAQQLVVLANVEEAATAFIEKTAGLRSRFERTWSVAHFKRTFGQPGSILDDYDDFDEQLLQQQEEGSSSRKRAALSGADIDVLLVFLSRDKHLVAYDGRVVTLLQDGGGGSGSSKTTRTTAVAITEEDSAVAQLRELLESLTHQTDVLSRRVDELTATARDAATVRKNRVAALAALRLKKQTETALATRFATLAQVEAAAARIEQAADNVQVVQAMDASASALQSLNAQVGGASGVDEVVERLREQMDAADEIGHILAEEAGGSAALEVDDAEITAELAALEEQQMQKLQGQTRVHDEDKEAAAQETMRRLAAVGPVPDSVPVPDHFSEGALEAVLEAETTASLRGLSINEPPAS